MSENGLYEVLDNIDGSLARINKSIMETNSLLRQMLKRKVIGLD